MNKLVQKMFYRIRKLGSFTFKNDLNMIAHIRGAIAERSTASVLDGGRGSGFESNLGRIAN